ncbi:MAG: chalcone isomerase family protein [Myxococcota bacterium]
MRTFLSLGLLFVATSVWAGTLEGVTLPDTVEIGDKTLQLNGMGIREATIFKVDVYVAGLYLENKTADAQKILDTDGTRRIVMKFVRDVDRDDLVKAWGKGFEKNNKNYEAIKDRIAELNKYMADTKKGQVMTFTYIPGVGTEVAIDGHTHGKIAGSDFGRALMAVWLGPQPPNSGLKNGLLGKS